MHGGTQPLGIASPNAKGLRYSDYMPTGLRKRFAELLCDPDCLSQREEIASVVALIQESLAMLGTGDDDGKVMDRLEKQLDLHRRLVESERKRMIENQQMIQLDQVLAMLDDIATTVLEHVTDRDALKAIGGSLSHYTGSSRFSQAG